MSRNIAPVVLLLLLTNCTEPFVIEQNVFERVLVVEATLTNEDKIQTVRLSRTVGLLDFGHESVSEAVVTIEDDQGNIYDFVEGEGGLYFSKEVFAARQQVSYVLNIRDLNGGVYRSSEATLPADVGIERLYAEKTSEGGETGVSVFVDSKGSEGDLSYFRYEFEETYEVVLPHPSPFSYEIVDYSSFTKAFRIELENRRFDLACYDFQQSQGIQQATTQRLEGGKLLRHPVRFIDEDDPILRDRYSILVRQFGQSIEAHTFYRTMADLGDAGDLLSQGQPGFVSGNMEPVGENNNRVMGFFEVATVSEQRIEFSHQDFDMEKPPYFVECDHLISYMMTKEELYRKLVFEGYQVFFFEEKAVGNSAPRPIYHISQSICSECVEFTTHEKPEFWQ